ncbi:hypothetical protein Tco_0526433 [Tanacetum coccineum]
MGEGSRGGKTKVNKRNGNLSKVLPAGQNMQPRRAVRARQDDVLDVTRVLIVGDLNVGSTSISDDQVSDLFDEDIMTAVIVSSVGTCNVIRNPPSVDTNVGLNSPNGGVGLPTEVYVAAIFGVLITSQEDVKVLVDKIVAGDCDDVIEGLTKDERDVAYAAILALWETFSVASQGTSFVFTSPKDTLCDKPVEANTPGQDDLHERSTGLNEVLFGPNDITTGVIAGVITSTGIEDLIPTEVTSYADTVHVCPNEVAKGPTKVVSNLKVPNNATSTNIINGPNETLLNEALSDVIPSKDTPIVKSVPSIHGVFRMRE